MFFIFKCYFVVFKCLIDLNWECLFSEVFLCECGVLVYCVMYLVVEFFFVVNDFFFDFKVDSIRNLINSGLKIKEISMDDKLWVR